MTSRQKEGSVSLTLGSLCTGYGGLDLAVDAVLDTSPVWLSEIEAAPAQVCEVRFPDVPNLGDLTVLDWSQVPPVDVLTAGYPCQPFSHAGRRKGTSDERHLWPYIADAIRVLRPKLVVLENVSGHLGLGFDVVLGDLAAIGFDAEWVLVRASDVGACHRRERLFILARHPENCRGVDVRRGGRDAGQTAREAGAEDVQQLGRSSGSTVADTGGVGWRPGTGLRANEPGWKRRRRFGDDDGTTAADPDCGRRAHDVEPDGRRQGMGAGSPPPGDNADRLDADASNASPPQWGGYADAVRRHEDILGRAAPAPVDAKGRLSPPFVEWMMMLPAGWVTDVLTTRTKALKCLGNGVVPPQAAYALSVLLEREAVAA